jgi:chromate reductase, NAD(P)H dehydrogenase (quinone)
MKIVAFAGALRKDSVSKKLVQETVRLLAEEHDLDADYVDLKEYPFPVYDSDIEQSIGIPESIDRLGKLVANASILVIASPEYNGGISSVLKTLVDWLSRFKPDPLAGKHLLLLSASPSGSGGVQGLWHTRVPFEALGVHVFPQMVAIPRATDVFDQNDRLVESKAADKLRRVLQSFVEHAVRHRPINGDENHRAK